MSAGRAAAPSGVKIAAPAAAAEGGAESASAVDSTPSIADEFIVGGSVGRGTAAAVAAKSATAAVGFSPWLRPPGADAVAAVPPPSASPRGHGGEPRGVQAGGPAGGAAALVARPPPAEPPPSKPPPSAPTAARPPAAS